MTSDQITWALCQYAKKMSERDKTCFAIDIFHQEDDEFSPKLRFDKYNGQYTKEAEDILKHVKRALDATESKLLACFRGATIEELYADKTGVDFESFLHFRVIFLCSHGPEPDPTIVESVIRDWRAEIAKGLKYLHYRINYKSYHMFYDRHERRGLIKEVISTAAKCENDEFTDNFVSVMRELCRSKPAALVPFVHFCAPCGAGKSIFGTNLGKTALPSLHWISKLYCDQQRCYLPFVDISIVMRDAFAEDLKRYVEMECDGVLTNESTGVERILMVSSKFKFESVHLVVKLFRKLFKIKSQPKNPKNPENPKYYSWLQAQFRVKDFLKRKMTIEKGAAELRRLSASRHPIGTPPTEFDPILAYIERCSLLPKEPLDASAKYQLEQMHRFTVSVLRLTGIVPIITGSDARLSGVIQSGLGDKDGNVSAIIYSHFPDYNSAAFNKKCALIEERFKGHPKHADVMRILGFLDTVRVHENPVLIETALEYLSTVRPAVGRSRRDLLNMLLLDLSEQFIRLLGRIPLINIGQQAYITSQHWQEGILKARAVNPSCIDSHLALLIGQSDHPGQPYFTLTMRDNAQHYSSRPSKWTPKAYFTSFHLAPLTGMVLFGLDLSFGIIEQHSWFDPSYLLPLAMQQNSRTRLSSLDVMLAECDEGVPAVISIADDAGECSPMGTKLEQLLRMALVFGSRARGASGCTLPEFLWNIIREMDTNMLALRESTSGNLRHNTKYRMFPRKHYKLAIIGTTDLDEVVVPVLAPMAVPEWPKSVFDLLNADNEEPLHLGVFEQTPESSCVIYETNLCDEDSGNCMKCLRLNPTEAKQYGMPELQIPLECTMKREVRIVAECKFWNHSVTIANLREDIATKFMQVDYDDCKTFIVVALTSNFCNTKDSGDIKWMNENRFYVWHLQREMADEQHSSFQLTPIEGQPEHQPTFRDVIVMGLTVIWEGSAVLELVMSKWGNEVVEG